MKGATPYTADTPFHGSPVRIYSVYSAYSAYSHTAIHAIHAIQHTALYILPQIVSWQLLRAMRIAVLRTGRSWRCCGCHEDRHGAALEQFAAHPEFRRLPHARRYAAHHSVLDRNAVRHASVRCSAADAPSTCQTSDGAAWYQAPGTGHPAVCLLHPFKIPVTPRSIPTKFTWHMGSLGGGKNIACDML